MGVFVGGTGILIAFVAVVLESSIKLDLREKNYFGSVWSDQYAASTGQ